MHRNQIINSNNSSPFDIKLDKIKTYESHWEKNIKFYFILNGNLQISKKDKIYSLKKGNIMILNSYEFHRCINASDDNIILGLTFKPELLYQHYPKYKNIYFNFDDDIFLNPDNEHSIVYKTFISNIFYINYSSYKGSNIEIMKHIYELISYTLKNIDQISENNISKSSTENLDRIQKIKEYINDNIELKIYNEDIAKLINVSEGYLSSYFKLNVGLSIQEYINMLRLEKSIVLLETTNQKISTVAKRCGFSSASFYNTIFQRYLKISPSKYRNNLLYNKKENYNSNNLQKHYKINNILIIKKLKKYSKFEGIQNLTPINYYYFDSNIEQGKKQYK